MDLEDKKKQKEKGELTPIVDGDARPDMEVNPQEQGKEGPDATKEKDKFTGNRMDKNSLEDYKDAKTED